MVVRIDPGPKIFVRAEGAKLAADEMRRYLPVVEEGIIDDDLLAEGRNNLIDFFQSKGYFGVEVDFEVERSTEDESVVVYTIRRGNGSAWSGSRSAAIPFSIRRPSASAWASRKPASNRCAAR